VAGAADALQDVHVETFGSISKRDKIEFILEQMRLTLAKQDYVRAAIVAGKVSRKHLKEENMEEYKVKFFTLMTIYHRHDKDALELAKDYHAIYSTPHILADEAKWVDALQSTVVFLALSAYDNDQQDMLNRINLDTNLEKLPACQ
jgi:26S proteasome regulatory subunit N5